MFACLAYPQQPGGPPKPKAKGSDVSEPAAASEEATKCVSTDDVSWPLDGVPTDTTVASKFVPAGERSNKTLILVSVVTDIRELLA